MTHPLADTPARDRSVTLSVRSMLVLGVTCTLFGVVFVIAFGLFNSFQRFRPYFTVMGLVLWLGPGVAYLLSAHFVARHARGGATTGLAAVVVQAVGAAALLVASATFDPVTPVPIVLCLMWLIALADAARHLLRARRFLANGVDRVRGFEPLMGATQIDSLRGK
jgi:hypothetical protein